MPRRRKLRFEIADALIAGFAGAASVENTRSETRVHVDGWSEPIAVTRDGVTLPDWAKPLAPAIRLDVQAILSDRPLTSGGRVR